MCNDDTFKHIKISDYTYDLPDDRIAKYPLAKRSDSKLLIYSNGQIREKNFFEITEELSKGDLLIFNNTKVIHARLFFQKTSGANIEIFCLEPHCPVDYALNFASKGSCEWLCLVGNLKKWKEGDLVSYFYCGGQKYELTARKIKTQNNGELIIQFSWNNDISFSEVMESCGKIPIPPYLNRESEASDEIRYQTVYSKIDGSVAAPTAGLHFTEELLTDLRKIGVETCSLTLHVGAGTFRPVKAEEIGNHEMHTEHIAVDKNLIETLLKTHKRIIAVGTTSVRTLESIYWIGVKLILGKDDFCHVNQWETYSLPSNYTLNQSMSAILNYMNSHDVDILKASTTIIIVPGYKYRVITNMFTNFHQPQSTLLLLVAAAVGDDWRRIYNYAMNNGFRFLSYGDSNFLSVKNEN